MKWTLKIKAGALQFVLFIGVVIALLLLTFVALSHAHSLFGKKTELLVETVKQSNLGLDYAMKTQMVLNDTLPLPTPLKNQIEVKGIKEYWGIFEKYTIVSSFRKNRFTKSALVGKSNLGNSSALYLKDNKRPMIIVGKARITGDAFLPENGIRPGNISGNSFYGKTLVNGRKLQSNSQLPKLDLELRNHIANLLRNAPSSAFEEVGRLPNGTLIQNSFKSPTKIIQGDVINLSGVSLTGNIIVRAYRRIIVDASSNLKDIILLAPEIKIKNNVIGTFQAFASESISVGKKCTLMYPSALVVYQEKAFTKNNSTRTTTPNLSADSNTTIKGVLAYFGTKNEKQFSPQIAINSNVTIWGSIYCEENLELKGRVMGNVITNAFIAMERGSIYQNHLFNGQINSLLLPEQYVGLLMADQNGTKAICKWLY